MARKEHLRQSGIEQFVIGYLAKFRHVTNKRSKRRFIQKAISLIGFYLDRPCCVDGEVSISYSRFNDDLTRYVANTLNGPFDRRRYKKSLERARNLLENFLNDPCCVDNELITAVVDASGYTPGELPLRVQITFGCEDNILYDNYVLIDYDDSEGLNTEEETLQQVVDSLNTIHGGQYFVISDGDVVLTDSNGPLPEEIQDIVDACEGSLEFGILITHEP